MRKSQTLYPDAGWWFLLFLPLVAVGFYPTYFAVFFKPAATVIHIHFVLMALWVIVLVAQPFLFKYKKLQWHRMVGKFTYVLVPFLLASSFLMIRYSYTRFLNSPSLTALANRQAALEEAALYMSIAFVYFGLLALFYTLAIINRRKAAVHARYMVATALTLLGPTVDRIIFAVVKDPKIGGVIPGETVAFLLADSIQLYLLWKDYRAKRSVKTLAVCLTVYMVVQAGYFLFRGTTSWAAIVTWIMQADT